VELGYDRSIPPWEPTPARLIPTLDPAKVTADLVSAIGEGFNNALTLVGAPPVPNISRPLTTAKEYLSPQTTPIEQDRVKARTETTGAKVFSQVMTDVVSRTRQLFTRPAASASMSKPAKPNGQSPTRWPVEPGSLRIGQWLHRGNGRQRDTLTGARPSASSSSEPFRLHKEMGFVHTKMAASS
jgi:hypothetical protein